MRPSADFRALCHYAVTDTSFPVSYVNISVSMNIDDRPTDDPPLTVENLK